MNPNGVFYRTGCISRRVVIPHQELDSLERRHAMKVLLVLRDRGSMGKTELAESINSGAGSVSSRIDELLEAGLLRIDEELCHPFRKVVSLTELGGEVAELVAAISKKMSKRFRRSPTACTF